MAVKGAWILALKTAAIPIIIKLIGITPAFKKVFKIEAINNPRKAPIKRLGAKTPPSPPEASVIEVTIGFNSINPKNVKANVRVNGISVELPKMVFME